MWIVMPSQGYRPAAASRSPETGLPDRRGFAVGGHGPAGNNEAPGGLEPVSLKNAKDS
jgi:hypothetical protein